MLFNSYEFLGVFLPVAFVAFHGAGLAGWSRAKLPILLALSVVFYLRSLGPFWYVLFISIFWNFIVGRSILTFLREKNDARARTAMRVGVAGDIALLGYFKYSIFVQDILGFHPKLSMLVIPLGISFYTFTQIAFLIDLSRGEVRECKFLNFSLFVTYFPHLIAGPIIHHKDVIPQFEQISRGEKITSDDLTIGFTLFAIGLFKKTVIADSLAPLVTAVFDQHAAGLGFSDHWLASIAYAMQLYFDFSAYSDMALGISLLFGVRLPINFLSPYKATSIIDFWRRWHISLSNFLRDYVYFSLGGNKAGRLRKYLNIFVTMLLGGIWHGSGYTFVAWGAIHGILILLNHVWRDFFSPSTAFLPVWLRPLARSLSWLITFICVLFAWVFFRSTDIDSATRIVVRLMTPAWGPARSDTIDWMIVIMSCLVAWLLPNAYEIVGWGRKAGQLKPALATLRQSRIYAPVFGLLFGIAILFIQRRSEFLYWQF